MAQATKGGSVAARLEGGWGAIGKRAGGFATTRVTHVALIPCHCPSPVIANAPLPKLTASQKLRIASRLYATARKVKLAGIRRRHKDWPEERLMRELNMRFFLLHD